jgi:hypothetical protein
MVVLAFIGLIGLGATIMLPAGPSPASDAQGPGTGHPAGRTEAGRNGSR